MTGAEIGSIYRAVADEAGIMAALVLVTSVDRSAQSAAVTLLSPDVEFGSSVDLILPGNETGLAYDLLVESDIFGYIQASQLDRHIAQVDAPVLVALAALRTDEAVDRRVAGPPVTQRDDPRWSFKLQELQRLQHLSPCDTQ